MAPTKKQKQAQRQQEQLVSQALTQDTPKTSHRSFDDDDDDVDASPSIGDSRAPVGLANQNGATDSEDDADDAPIEVVSNRISRKQAAEQSSLLKAQEKEARAKRREAENSRIEQRRKADTSSGKRPEPSASASFPPSPDMRSTDEGEQSHSQTEGPSRLDPSLFAQVFTKPISQHRSILKKRTAEQEADEVAKLKAERKKRRKQQRSGGVILGRDGLPMKRAEDGTVLRALETTGRRVTKFDDIEAAEPDVPLDIVLHPTPLDPSISLPNAKARAYKKRHLEKKGLGQSKAQVASASKASQKSEDDPLGLNDPAFLPGGEFYHLVNKKRPGRAKTAGVPGTVAKQGFRGGGTRKEAVSVLRSRSRAGPSLGFARSQSS